MRTLFVLVSVLAFVAPGGARAADRCVADGSSVRVMLQDLQTTPSLASSRATLAQIVATEAARVPGYDVISADEVRAALDQEANKALAGCTENSCLAEIAQALDAQLVVSGALSETTDGVLVSLSILNVRAMVVMNRVAMTWRGARGELPDVVRTAAQTLLLEPKDRPPGRLSVLGAPPDAHVYVDGVDCSVDAHSGSIAGLALGPHEIKVEASGHVPAVAYAVVKASAPTAVTVEMEESAAVWPWVLGAVGGTVLLGGAAVVVALVAGARSDVVVEGHVASVGVNDAETVRKK